MALRTRRPGASGVRQAVRRDGGTRREHRAALPSPPARRQRFAVGGARAQRRGPGPGRRSSGRATGSAFIGRGRSLRAPAALDGRALSGTTGVVLDPICSLRQRVRLGPGRPGAAVVRHRSGATIATRHWPWRRSTTTRARRRARSRSAFTHTQSLLHHLAARPRTRGSSSGSPRACSTSTSRAGAGSYVRRQCSWASRDCGGTASRAICRSCWCASAGAPRTLALVRAGAPGAGVLAAQGAVGRRRHPQRGSDQLPRRTPGPADRRCSTRGRGGRWRIGRAGRTCCAATT